MFLFSSTAGLGVEGILAGAVVRRIDHFLNFRNELSDSLLNTLLEGHVYHPATVTSTSEGQIGLVVPNPKELNLSTMGGHGRIQLGIDESLDLFGYRSRKVRSRTVAQLGDLRLVGVQELESASHDFVFVINGAGR